MRTGCETPRFPHMRGLLLATTENSRTSEFYSDGVKYYFQNLLRRRRAAIVDSCRYVFVSAKLLILQFLTICNKNENIGL